MVSATKDPIKVQAGQLGALKRWGAGPRVVRLTDLDPAVAEAVRALIAAHETAERREGETP